MCTVGGEGDGRIRVWGGGTHQGTVLLVLLCSAPYFQWAAAEISGQFFGITCESRAWVAQGFQSEQSLCAE